MSPAGISPDARAVVRAIEALTTQVRRATDALTTTAAQAVVGAATAKQTDYALAPTPTDDAPTTCPTPLTHNWGCGCSSDPLPAGGPRFALLNPRNTGWFWECRDCGAGTGKFSTRDQASDSTRVDHPQCPPDPNGPWAYTIQAGAGRVSDPPTTPPAAPVNDAPVKVIGHWLPMTDQRVEEMQAHTRLVAEWVDGQVRQARATDEETQRTTRRASLGHLLGRAERGALVSPKEGALLRQHVEAELRLSDQLAAGRATWKAKAEEIERDRDRLAAEREQLRDVLEYEHKRANDAINREETAEQAAEEQRRRGDIFETELRVLREGLRAIGADPTQIQNLWAQIRLRNRQWRDTKRALRVTRGMLEAEGGDVALVDEMLATVEAAEGRARDAQDAIERVRSLRDPIAAALEQANYRQDMRRGDLADSIMPVIRAALDGTEQPTTEA